MQRCDMTLKYEMVIQLNEKLWVKFREKHPSYVDNGKGGYQLVVQEEATGKAELFDAVNEPGPDAKTGGDGNAKDDAGKTPHVASAKSPAADDDFDNVDDLIAEIEGLDYGPPDG